MYIIIIQRFRNQEISVRLYVYIERNGGVKNGAVGKRKFSMMNRSNAS